MKFVKLYEAFESIKLGRTMNFINKDSKEKFKSWLNNIADRMDFPISEFSDEYFQYLPFKRALDLNYSVEDQPCSATSRQAFPQYEVAGEVCRDGRIKRKWGTGVRSVVCPICNGTGLRKKDSYDIKWIKFWFDKDGNWVNVTGTDGQVRPQNSGGNFSISSSWSRNKSDYTVSQNLNASQIKALPTGSFVWINLEGRELVGRVWQGRYDRTFIIQDLKDGSSDEYSNEWRTMGPRSWCIAGSGDFRGTPQLLTPLVQEEPQEEEKVDPYTWNALLSDSIRLSTDRNVQTRLANAHFALVLDYIALKKSEFTKKSEIKGKRHEFRSGAAYLKSDEEIRRENINRYFQKISFDVEVGEDLSSFKKIITRFFGWRLSGLYVMRNRNLSKFNNLIQLIYNTMRSTDESDKQYYMSQLKDIIKSVTQANLEFNNIANKTLRTIDQKIISSDLEPQKRIMGLFYEINEVISNIVRDSEIETIEDLEVLFFKLNNLSNSFRSGDRFNYARKGLYRVSEYIEYEDRSLRELESIDTDYTEDIVKNLNTYKRICEKI